MKFINCVFLVIINSMFLKGQILSMDKIMDNFKIDVEILDSNSCYAVKNDHKKNLTLPDEKSNGFIYRLLVK